MDAPLNIRPADPDDARALFRVHTEAIRRMDDRLYPAELRARWLSRLSPEDYAEHSLDELLVVAERGGEVVAFGHVDVRGGELKSLYVHPAHAGAGVGAGLLRHLEARARQAGLERLEVLATLTAEGFYARRGFRVLGLARKRVASDFWVEGVQMEKRL